MADARLPERYLADRRILRLAAGERSSLFMAMIWSVSNRTDGRIERGDLGLIPTFDPSAVPALEAAELWVRDGADAWVMADYARDQTTRSEFEVLENARRREREKKRRQRAKGDGPEGTSPGTVPRDDTGKARQGQDRQETGKEGGEAVDAATGEVTSWSVRKPGEPEAWIESDSGEFVPMGRGAA
jgi:hypothetical protein